MNRESVEIPASVISSVETLDRLQDWLTAQNPGVIAELRAARGPYEAARYGERALP